MVRGYVGRAVNVTFPKIAQVIGVTISHGVLILLYALRDCRNERSLSRRLKNYSNRPSRKISVDPQSWQKFEKIENPWIFVIKIRGLSQKLSQIAKNPKNQQKFF